MKGLCLCVYVALVGKLSRKNELTDLLSLTRNCEFLGRCSCQSCSFHKKVLEEDTTHKCTFPSFSLQLSLLMYFHDDVSSVFLLPNKQLPS